MSRAARIVLWKEIVDNLRDRRALLSTLLFGPLLGPVIFALITASALEIAGGEHRSLELPIAGAERAPNLVAFLRQHDVRVVPPPDAPEAAVRGGTHDVVLVVPEAFAASFRAGRPAPVRLVVDASAHRAAAAAARVRALLRGYSKQIGQLRLLVRGIDPQAVDAVAVATLDVSTPESRSVQLLGMLPYFLIFAILIGGFHLAIDTTAGERERGSLEALLASPVRRSELMLGKFGATCVFSAVSLVLALLGCALSLARVPLEDASLRSGLGLVAMAPILGISLPFVLLGSALLTVVASFTRSVKEAQTYLSALILVPMAPIFWTLLSPVRPRLWMMFIPSLSQHILITDVMRGQSLEAGALAASAGSTLLLGAGAIWLAARLYERERMLG